MNQNVQVHIKDAKVKSYTSSFRLTNSFRNVKIPLDGPDPDPLLFQLPASDLIKRQTMENTISHTKIRDIICQDDAIKNAETEMGAPRDNTSAYLSFVELPEGLVYVHF
jgi:hypothetical protein